MPHHSYNVLLHLCTGGNQPDGPKKRVMPQQAEEVSFPPYAYCRVPLTHIGADFRAHEGPRRVSG